MSRSHYPWLKVQKDTYLDVAIARLTLAEQAVFYNLLQYAGRQPEEGSFDDSDRERLALEVAQEDETTLNSAIDRLLKYKVLIRLDEGRVAFRRYHDHQVSGRDVNAERQRRFYAENRGKKEGDHQESNEPLTVPNSPLTVSNDEDSKSQNTNGPSISISTSPSLSRSHRSSDRKVTRKRNEKIADPDPEVMASLKEIGMRVTRQGHALLVKVRDKHPRVDFSITALSTVAYIRETRGDDVPENEIIDAICSSLARYDDEEWRSYWRTSGADTSGVFESPIPDELGPSNTPLWGQIRVGVAEQMRGNYAVRFGGAADSMRGDVLVLSFPDDYEREWASKYAHIVESCAESCGYPDLKVEYVVSGEGQRAPPDRTIRDEAAPCSVSFDG